MLHSNREVFYTGAETAVNVNKWHNLLLLLLLHQWFANQLGPYATNRIGLCIYMCKRARAHSDTTNVKADQQGERKRRSYCARAHYRTVVPSVKTPLDVGIVTSLGNR